MKAFIYTLAILFVFLQGKSQTASQTHTALRDSAQYPTLWTNLNPASLSTDDNQYASIKNSTGSVFLSDFGFTIPLTATINSITLIMRKFATGNIVTDYYVSLLSNCCSKGPNLTKSTAWPLAEDAVNYFERGSGTGFNGDAGGNAYTWSAAEINNPRFRVMFIAKKNLGKPANIYLDQVTVTVNYTIPLTLITTVNKTQALTTNGKKLIEIWALPNKVVVTTPITGKYFLIISDLLGRRMEEKIIYTTKNSPNIITLNNTLKGGCVITCTGNGLTQTIKWHGSTLY